MRTRVSQRAPRESGLTLIELMIAMLVGSILMWFVLSIYARMSMSYRATSTVSELQQTLQAARNHVEPELRQAGYALAPGFKIQGDAVTVVPPLSVDNDADASGTDIVRFYAADASRVARVLEFADPSRAELTVDDPGDFAVGDVVVLVNPKFRPSPLGGGAADIVEYDACVLRITGIAGSTVTFDSSDVSYNVVNNAHCTDLQNTTQEEAPNPETMLYGFSARAYRIDPNRKDLAVLQMSPSGELIEGDWVDLGIGFVDLQVSTRFFEKDDSVDADGDGDPERDWYSAENQETPILDAIAIQVGISFIARTDHSMQTVGSSAVPALTDPAFPDNNRFGNRGAVALKGIADSSRLEEHKGNHIYRHSSSAVDIRNLGVGR